MSQFLVSQPERFQHGYKSVDMALEIITIFNEKEIYKLVWANANVYLALLFLEMCIYLFLSKQYFHSVTYFERVSFTS